MFNKSALKSIPLAAALAAAMMFGASAHAQTGTAASNNAPTGIAGTTSGKDAIDPDPRAGKGMPARSAAAGNAESMPIDPNKTDTAGTTKSKNNVSPAPTAGSGKTAEERTAMKADKKAAKDAKRAQRMAVRKTSPMSGEAKSDTGGTK